MNHETNDIGAGWFFVKATSDNKKFVNILALHEFKNELLRDYNGDFEMIGDIFNGKHKQTTAIKFKTTEYYESYIINVDMDYDADVIIFTDYGYKLKTLEIKNVNRSEYGKITDYKQDIVEVIGKNCYIPTSGYCFKKKQILFNR